MSHSIFYKIDPRTRILSSNRQFYFQYDGNIEDGRKVWKFGNLYYLDFMIYEAHFFCDKFPEYSHTALDGITHYLFEIQFPISKYHLAYSFPEGYFIPTHLYKFYQLFPYVTKNHYAIKSDETGEVGETCEQIEIDQYQYNEDDYDGDKESNGSDEININIDSFFTRWKHITQTSRFKKIYQLCIHQTSKIFQFMKKKYDALQIKNKHYCLAFFNQIKSDIHIKQKKEKKNKKRIKKQIQLQKKKELIILKEKIKEINQKIIIKKAFSQWKYFISLCDLRKKRKCIQENVIKSWHLYMSKYKHYKIKITKKYLKIWVDNTFREKRLLEKKLKKKQKKKSKIKAKKIQKNEIQKKNELSEIQFNQNLFIDYRLKHSTIYKIPLLSSQKQQWLHIMKKNITNSDNSEFHKKKLACLNRKQITHVNKICDDDLKIIFLNLIPYLKPTVMSTLSMVNKQWNHIWKQLLKIPKVMEYFTSVFMIIDITLRNYIIKTYADHKIIMTNNIKHQTQIMIKKKNTEVPLFDDQHINMLEFKKNILSLNNKENINVIECIKKSITLYHQYKVDINTKKYRNDLIDDFFPGCNSPLQLLVLCIASLNIELDCMRDICDNDVFPFENIGMVVDDSIMRNPILSRPIPNPLYIDLDSVNVIKNTCLLIKLITTEHRCVQFLAQGDWSEYNELIEIAVKLESNAIQFAEYCEEWLKVYTIYFTLTESWNTLYNKNICSVCGEFIEDKLYITKSCKKKSKPHYYHMDCVFNDHTINNSCLGCLLQDNYNKKSNENLEYFEYTYIPYEIITHNIVTKTVNCPLNYKVKDPTCMFLDLMSKHKNYDKLCYDNNFLNITKKFECVSASILNDNKELVELKNAYEIITKKYGNHNDTHMYYLNDKCVYKEIIGLQISLVATKEDIDNNKTLVKTIFDNDKIYKTVYARMLQHIIKCKSKKENNTGIVWCVKNNDGYAFFVYSSWITIVRKNL